MTTSDKNMSCYLLKGVHFASFMYILLTLLSCVGLIHGNVLHHDYVNEVTKSKPLHYWRLNYFDGRDEMKNIGTDLLLLGSNSTVQGGITGDSINTGIELSSETSIEIPPAHWSKSLFTKENIADLAPNSFSLEFLIKVPEQGYLGSNDNSATILSQGDAYYRTFEVAITEDSGRISIAIGAKESASYRSYSHGTRKISDGKWHHVVINVEHLLPCYTERKQSFFEHRVDLFIDGIRDRLPNSLFESQEIPPYYNFKEPVELYFGKQLCRNCLNETAEAELDGTTEDVEEEETFHILNGALDEIAYYDRLLLLQEIVDHDMAAHKRIHADTFTDCNGVTFNNTCTDVLDEECFGSLRWIGDGQCDAYKKKWANLNCVKFRFDGYDCCKSTCQSHVYDCGSGESGYTCEDPILPVLNFSGSDHMELTIGEDFQEPGYTAIDAVDGDITDRVVVTGTVDASQAGSYILGYSVTDSSHSTAVKKRFVTVRSRHTSNQIIGVSVGSVLLLIAFIGIIGLYTHRKQKNRLLSQFCIDVSELTDIAHSTVIRDRLTAMLQGRLVSMEPLCFADGDVPSFQCSILLGFSHTNVASFIGITTVAPELYLIKEHCSKGGLDVLIGDGLLPMDTAIKMSFSLDAASGLGYLHAKGVPHGRITLCCLRIDSHFVCKVSGFHLSQHLQQAPPKDIVLWLAPEVITLLSPDQVAIFESSNSEDFADLYEDFVVEPNSYTNCADEKLVNGNLELYNVTSQLSSSVLILADLYSFGSCLFSIWTENVYPYGEEIHVGPSMRFKREALRISIINECQRPRVPDEYKIKRIDRTATTPDDKSIVMMLDMIDGCWDARPEYRASCVEFEKSFRTKGSTHQNLIENLQDKYNTRLEELVNVRTRALRAEKEDVDRILERVERLLGNIVPSYVLEQLQSGEAIVADEYSSTAVCDIRIAGFSEIEASPRNLVMLLSDVFSQLDMLASQYDMHRVKTSKDRFIAVCGIPEYHEHSLERSALFAMAATTQIKVTMIDFDGPGDYVELSAGISYGTVVAGVTAKGRVAYDVWGHPCDEAADLCNLAPNGGVVVSASTVTAFSGGDYYGKRIDEDAFILSASSERIEARERALVYSSSVSSLAFQGKSKIERKLGVRNILSMSVAATKENSLRVGSNSCATSIAGESINDASILGFTGSVFSLNNKKLQEFQMENITEV